MPGLVASITLLDPAGLTRPDARFWWWLSISGLASLTPMPLRRRLARWLDSPAMLQPELTTLMWAAIRGYRAEPKFPGVLTDNELRAITVPVLLITGARSAMLTPAEARTQGSIMPHAEVAIVPGSHGGFNRVDELNGQIAAFITSHATGQQADPRSVGRDSGCPEYRISGPKARPGLVCGESCSSGAAAHPANDFIAGKAVLQHPWHELIGIDRIRQVP